MGTESCLSWGEKQVRGRGIGVPVNALFMLLFGRWRGKTSRKHKKKEKGLK